jgi:hypothetical protein
VDRRWHGLGTVQFKAHSRAAAVIGGAGEYLIQPDRASGFEPDIAVDAMAISEVRVAV